MPVIITALILGAYITNGQANNPDSIVIATFKDNKSCLQAKEKLEQVAADAVKADRTITLFGLQCVDVTLSKTPVREVM